MKHYLKTWPEYFEKVVNGQKPFELRKNDRHFQEKDILILKEWDPIDQEYSGRSVEARVLYVFNGGGTLGLMEGYVIMGIELTVIHPNNYKD